MNEHVKIDINNGIGIIDFFHPQSNSLPSHILNQLANFCKSYFCRIDLLNKLCVK